MYPLATRWTQPATIYGPLPDHGFTQVALVLHTTETRGMPGFNHGDTAPHYVYDPRDRTWWCWATFDEGYVGTLKGHSTAFHGNCQAFQVEILCYSDQPAAASVGGLWVGDLTADHYADLAQFVAWSRFTHGIDATVTPTPAGGWLYGTSSPHRLTDQQWTAFGGLTAHGAVPGNTHWDTGVLDLQRINDLAGSVADMDWADIVSDDTWTVAYEQGYIEGSADLLPDYYFADGPATEAEKMNAYQHILAGLMQDNHTVGGTPGNHTHPFHGTTGEAG